ncbi:MAG: 6-phosphogluconolactonase [Cyanobacteria bacterium J06600_6]
MAILNQNVEVLADKPALVDRAYEITIEKISRAIAKQDRFTIALAGGSTPKPLYEKLAQADLPWSKIHVFWGDERYVPADHPDSNQLMARQAWLDKIDIPADNIHPMKITGTEPALDAKQHETEIKEFFQIEQGFPKFDLILLGMGDDGHTASLFPQTEALSVEDRLVTVGNHHGQPRITFTIPLINQADCVVFLVAGENKRPALKQVFATQGDEKQYPSRSIQPKGELLWLLDRAAAEEL